MISIFNYRNKSPTHIMTGIVILSVPLGLTASVIVENKNKVKENKMR